MNHYPSDAICSRSTETKQFILYLDNAKYYSKPCVTAWLARHPQFRLKFLPPYSPNLNLIERLWKLLREGGVLPEIRLVRGDAAGRVRRPGPPAEIPPAVGHADDRGLSRRPPAPGPRALRRQHHLTVVTVHRIHVFGLTRQPLTSS